MFENLETINTETYVGETRELEATQSLYAPRAGVFYYYQWGARILARGNMLYAVWIQPAVIVGGHEDDAVMMEFESLSEAKIYCSEAGTDSARLVITLRIRDNEHGSLLKVERADYPGYLHTLTYASELTGMVFDDMASPANALIEEPQSIGYRIRLLRKLRQRQALVEAALLEQQISIDFKHRHDRNVTS